MPFTIPGHKRSTSLIGDVIAGDVPLHAGLDTMGLAHGRLAEAEERAAQLWDADWCRFSVGGSTHGNQALALAVAKPGDTVIVTRNLHRSLFLGLVLAGLTPAWVMPDVDTTTGLPTGVSTSSIDAALQANPNARAVFLVEPSYVGAMSDVAAIADLVHRAGVSLIVDQAWGGHFGFHPRLPAHALALGADAFVTSIHKALPGYSQAALVAARTQRLDAVRLERAFDATHTTSPAGSILASIDGVRALLEQGGEALLERTLQLVATARKRLASIDGVLVAGQGADAQHFDGTKLVLSLRGTGASGFAVEADLIGRGLPVEMADRDTIVAMVTMGDTTSSVDRLVDAIERSIERHRGAPHTKTAAVWSIKPEPAMTPREAFFADHETVPAREAIGRVSAELLAPYPPGIPAIAPGEVITAEIIEMLQSIVAEGGRVAYAADPSLANVQIVCNSYAGDYQHKSA